MTTAELDQFRHVLTSLAARLQGDMGRLEEQARTPTGGEAAGSLSNAPMHLADMATEQYLQALNATLLENEDYIGGEVGDALGRLDRGTFGLCERCGTAIMIERLEVLPYTRYCTPCAEVEQAGRDVNLNGGRRETG
jgi:RNA polymerase-binding transcription factor DksA